MLRQVHQSIFALALAPILLVGCGDPQQDEGTSDSDTDTDTDTDTATGGDGECAAKGDTDAYVVVESDITSDTTWTCDSVYVLPPDTQLFVTGATLTIEPGVTVVGNNGAALVIEKDGMLMAEGTADAPIVMTSIQATPARGDWGGLVFLGEARANVGSGQAEGFATAPTYGGENDDHNCGTLAYARVEWAGFEISDGNELNGITFYACGSATDVHHVQAHMTQDDGIEFFGGTFDAHHLVVTGAADDSLDVDQGFRGELQHLLIQQDPAVGDNCFEISNQGTDFTAEPINSPVICNATCIGSGSSGEKSKGFTLKEGTEVGLHSVIFTNATNEAALVTNAQTQTVAEEGGITIANNIFFGNGSPEFIADTDGWADADWQAWVLDPANANLQEDPGFGSIEWGSLDATPGAAADGSGAVPCADTTSYIGAVDPNGEDWTAAAWINYGLN